MEMKFLYKKILQATYLVLINSIICHAMENPNSAQQSEFTFSYLSSTLSSTLQDIRLYIKTINDRNAQLFTNLIITGQIPISYKDGQGYTPLHYISLFDENIAIEVIKVLDNCKIDYVPLLEHKNSSGNTPLHYILEKGYFTLAEYLLGKVIGEIQNPNSWEDNALTFSFEENKFVEVKENNTLLMYAVKFAHVEFIKWLIKHKINDINHKNFHGQTALMFAAQLPNPISVKIVEILIHGGASLTIQDECSNHTLSFLIGLFGKYPSESKGIKQLIMKIVLNEFNQLKNVSDDIFKLEKFGELIHIAVAVGRSSETFSNLTDSFIRFRSTFSENNCIDQVIMNFVNILKYDIIMKLILTKSITIDENNNISGTYKSYLQNLLNNRILNEADLQGIKERANLAKAISETLENNFVFN